MSDRGPATGLGNAPQPEQGGGEGRFDGARFWKALVVGKRAVQLFSAPCLGEGVFVAGLAVEAASQTEPQDQGHRVTLRDVLRAAALAAHRPDAAETDALLPSVEPAPATPVERGDLPPFGDGAPDNHVDVGG
ncbi:hypothetical protein [Streptomyces tendae]|uniref:hypothetical protein n=1 Tax=Streptomyces tendae TaxID=1932 RepID=UPI0036A67AD6